ncbi:MotE family protein [Primorskyibacter sp. 2E107]|uniref:MotE family protein n=1 Tax=Primorskyibacter sp. 2E107 TaxID=3403458 RepID=UPI003AF48965
MAKDKILKPASKVVAKKKKSRKPMRGALTAVGGLLIASAVLRTAIGASEAFAREGAANEPMTQTAATSHDAGDQMAALAPSKPANAVMDSHTAPMIQRVADEDVMPLIEALNKREARVEQREEDIEVRMQALSLAEQEIDRKLAELQDAETKLRSTLALAQTAAEDDLTRLTEVYANMKPKQAAALFEEMDPEFAAGFLGRMRANSAAAIMAGLTPGAAYTISVVLAGRNANVPKE